MPRMRDQGTAEVQALPFVAVQRGVHTIATGGKRVGETRGIEGRFGRACGDMRARDEGRITQEHYASKYEPRRLHVRDRLEKWLP